MPRKREKLAAKHERALVDLMASGKTLDEIVSLMASKGVTLSRATLARRMRELRGVADAKRGRAVIPDPTRAEPPRPRAPARPKRAADPAPIAEAPAVEPTPDELDTLDDEIIDQEIARWRRTVKAAEEAKDYRALEGAGRVLATYLDQKRKRKVPDRQDPNDDPDLKSRALIVVSRLHDYVSKIERLGAIEVEIPK